VRWSRREAGLTLIELLVTVALMGAAFGAILAGVSGVSGSGDTTRKVALVEMWLRRYAESVESTAYVSCATPANYTAALTPSPPTNYTAQINTVEYWNGSATTTWPATTQAACVSAGDKGVQRITLQVSNTEGNRGMTKTVVIVKRNPA
jgi:type II secretory pathway pseudopilin PulG